MRRCLIGERSGMCAGIAEAAPAVGRERKAPLSGLPLVDVARGSPADGVGSSAAAALGRCVVSDPAVVERDRERREGTASLDSQPRARAERVVCHATHDDERLSRQDPIDPPWIWALHAEAIDATNSAWRGKPSSIIWHFQLFGDSRVDVPTATP